MNFVEPLAADTTGCWFAWFSKEIFALETDFWLNGYLRGEKAKGRLHGKGGLVVEGGLVGGDRLQGGEVRQHCPVKLDNRGGLTGC